jgi:hypothetical protein
MQPWTAFFNGDSTSNRLTAATLPAAKDSTRLFLPAQARNDPGQFLGCPAQPYKPGDLALELRDLQLLGHHLPMAREGLNRIGADLLHPFAQNILMNVQVSGSLCRRYPTNRSEHVTVRKLSPSNSQKLTSIRSFWTEIYQETMVSHCFCTSGDGADALQILAKASALPVVD